MNETTCEFFDVNAAVGRPTRPVHGAATTPRELISRLDRVGIARSLVWHVAQRDGAPRDGNRLITSWTAATARLFGCWTILPPRTGEVVDADFFPAMRRHRIVALRAFPVSHRFTMTRAGIGPFLDELADRHVPLLLSVEDEMNWAAIHALMASCPTLTCVLCNIGVWGQARQLWPLMERYERLFVDTSLLALGAGNLAATVTRFGAGRVLFGTGFPAYYATGAMMEVLHADLAAEDRAAIAAGNFGRLMRETRL